ncbi:uncharacterized protein DFL_000430 [Arthrobotrys flagrans]|uniref:C3H1-type domain-containing protein n=1 Tax=Arthrobotrys flagrans TaxID=97331 RepID=A0A437AFA3_ARTFL|nr:hypothetical protein DFL_000430 [Arthrobotrys flagrans]
MSQVPQDIRNAMATTLCAVMRARGSCQTPHCMYSHEKRKFVCPSEYDTGVCKNAYCHYRHLCDGNGQPLGPGQSGYRAPRQSAAPKSPPPPPPPQPAAITKWNAPDPICANQAERDMVSLFRYPIRCPLELQDLERRQMMDYATKLLNHHKPHFQRYAVREMSEPLAHTHFLDITNILMNDESGGNTFGVIIFLTRFVPLARLLGQPYWRTDNAVKAIFKKFLDDILPAKLYNIYLIARGVASFISFQGSDNDDIEWPSLFVDMLHCFLNMGKFSKNHVETVGFSACDYWLICFIEQACDAWFGNPVATESLAMNVTPRPPKDVIFDELAELVSLYNLSRFFDSGTYSKGQRHRLDDIRRVECPHWLRSGSCPREGDDSCFFSHRLRLIDKHVEKSDKKFRSMELWLKFGSRREIVTVQDLKSYWDQALEFLNEGSVGFIFESLMRKEGSFLMEKTLKIRAPDGRDLNCDAIRSFAKIISDERLEEYNQKESKVVAIADVFVKNQKFFVAWTKDIRDGLQRVPGSQTFIEAAELIIGPVRFMLSLNPINKLGDETKQSITELCRIVAWYSAENELSMAEANTVAERLGLLIRRNFLEKRIEFIERDAPDVNAVSYDDAVSLVFSDDVKRPDEEQTVLAILPSESVCGDLIDTGSAQASQNTPPELHSDLAKLLKYEPMKFTTTQQENVKKEVTNETAAEQKLVAKKSSSVTPNDAAPGKAPEMVARPIEPFRPVVTASNKNKAALTEKSLDDEDGTEYQPEDRGPSPNSASDSIEHHLLDKAIKSIADFFEFGLIRPAARIAEMEQHGHFTALKNFFTSERPYIFPTDPTDDVSIFSHFFPFLETISRKLVKHDLDIELGWKNIMGALFRKLWGPGEFVGFFRNGLRDFYLVHEDRARFNSGHRKLYRKATENMFRLLLGLSKANQLPRVDGPFRHLLLRFLRIFSEEYRPAPAPTPAGTGRVGTSTLSGSSATGTARISRGSQSYHRWSKVHALMNAFIARTGLVAFFKQVPAEVGRDPQSRPLFKHATTFVCPDQTLSACEFAVHCQFAHEPENASSPDEGGSLESDSGADTDSDSGTGRGEEVFFRATNRVGLQGGSFVSAFGGESAVSINTIPTVIDAMDVAYI